MKLYLSGHPKLVDASTEQTNPTHTSDDTVSLGRSTSRKKLDSPLYPPNVSKSN